MHSFTCSCNPVCLFVLACLISLIALLSYDPSVVCSCYFSQHVYLILYVDCCESSDSGMSENQGDRHESETPAKSPLETKPTMPPVYTVATKQLLLHRLPPVLTLHLKRFQQVRYGLQKITEAVLFPFILDLAPFCTGSCKVSVQQT